MITRNDVEELSYVGLLAALGESNRPPGGLDTIRRLAGALQLGPGHSVLHAGCNAGFLGRELVRRSGARLVGVDVDHAMVGAATGRSAAEGLAGATRYLQADMRALPFADQTFDVVISGGALAFVSGDHARAVGEWRRVVRANGLIADAELFYSSDPAPAVLDEVSAIMGVEVPVRRLDHWLELFESSPRMERYMFHVSQPGLALGEEAVSAYADALVERSSARVAPDAVTALRERLRATFGVFDRNMAHLSYAVFCYVSRPEDAEPALYV